ncbi:hypothetical protein [Halorubrum halodurans]|uniref:Uncharacterized protein n=1 Tax=Halorubrum halodurans TaxID=1383851 RepID=A0A256IQ00_9EURY|nr:hypothetical protein [Halorubrum halodurans]OYR58624.1 hypothetical protein DJ70_02545 [Halorubrum halodurans]
MENETSNSEYKRPPSYALSGRQRAYLSSGETGSYRESKLEGDVQKKVDNLGHRIDHLLTDISLLYQNGYLGEEHWQDAWLSLVGFDQWEHTPDSTFRLVDGFADTEDEPTPRDVADAFTLGSNPSRADRPTTAPAELARDVGSALYRLTIIPESGLDRERVLQEMAWGLVKGFYMENRPIREVHNNEPEDTPMAELLEYFDKRRDLDIEYNNDSREFWANMAEGKEKWERTEREIRERIRDILRAEGLPVSNSLERHRSDGAVEAISAWDVYLLLVDRLVDDVEPREDSLITGDNLGSAGQMALFKQEYGPADEVDVAELVTREDVLGVVSEYNLLTKAKLEPVVVDHAEQLEDTVWKTIDATDITDLLRESETALSSSEVAKELKTESHTGTVTKLCNDLAGREFDPALLEDNAGGWEFTQYGRLVAKSANRPTGSPRIGSVAGPDGNTKGRVKVIASVGETLGIEGWEFDEGHH